MYLHIGKDKLIDDNNIIAILNIETLKEKENVENIKKVWQRTRSYVNMDAG